MSKMFCQKKDFLKIVIPIEMKNWNFQVVLSNKRDQIISFT